ncbi:Cruciform DNA binding protein [Coniothyrium glycines]
MGKYTFTWEHAALDVFVTGTFDDWRKTVKLEKQDGIFKKTVELPKTHTQYKFVVNGNWCTNDSARKEDDGHGIINNVLLPEDIIDEPEPAPESAHASTISSAAPVASTAALAGAIAKEAGAKDTAKSTDSLPGAFPETPYAETPGSEPQTFNINPIAASSGLGNPIKLAPGEPVPDSRTFNDNTVSSTVNHDREPQEEASTFGVAPIPATAGAGNPIHLAPGEKVPDPSTFTSNTVGSTVKTDEASYSKADALPELAFTPQAERDAKGGMFGLPPVSGNLIPESSLPMGADAKVEQDTGVTIQSSAPTSTTAVLAGQVPLEPRGVPEIVSESQHEAGAPAEASANPEAVQEKKELEQELKEKVPEAPAAADNSYVSQATQAASSAYNNLPTAETVKSNTGAAAAAAAAGITTGAGLFTGAIYAAKDKAAETVGLNGSANANDVPAAVSESQREAHVAPEASSNPEAVREKSAVEQELLSEVPKTNAHGDSAPAIAVPAVVADSQREAHVSPEAAANSEAVADKSALESELLSKLPKTNEAGEPAPVITAETSATAPGTHTGAAVGGAAIGATVLGGLGAAAAASHSGSAARNVPEVVAESQQQAHVSPEAAANPEAVSEKKAVESELLKEVQTSNATGEPAPVPSAAVAGTHTSSHLSDDALASPKPLSSTNESNALNAAASTPAQVASSKPIDSNTNVAFAQQKPTTTEQTQPTVTTGVETTTTEATSSGLAAPETPKKDARKDSDVSPKGTPASQSIASGATEDKKKKRRSIFGKIKDKLSSKDKN